MVPYTKGFEMLISEREFARGVLIIENNLFLRTKSEVSNSDQS